MPRSQRPQRLSPRWSGLPGHERARYLYAIARTVAKHARVFAVLESLDNGKPIRETRDIDVPVVIRHFYYHAGWAQTLEREFPGYRPGGVVAQIIPWNFPFLMLAWKIAPAIAAGNTVVLKPSKSTPLTALAALRYADERGGPSPGRRQHRDRRLEDRDHAVRASRTLEGHLHRFDGGRPHHPEGDGRARENT